MRNIAAALAVLLAAACGAAVSMASSVAPSASTPCATGSTATISHVIVIYEENEPYGKVIGNSAAPYQNQLANECGLATNLHNISHPSLPNYIGSTSGTRQGGALNSDCPYSKCPQSQANLFSELDAAGIGWAYYAESAPSKCAATNTTLYAQRHVPAVYYTNIHSTSCPKDVVPMTSGAWGPKVNLGAFDTAVTNGTLPTVSYITPNLCDDGHTPSISGCGSNAVADIDAWLKAWLPFIMNGPNYTAGTTDIAIVYDEGTGSDRSNGEKCWDATHANSTSYPSCHVAGLFIGPKVPATKSSTDFNLMDVMNAVASIGGVSAFPGNSTTGMPTGHSIRSAFSW